MSAVCIGMFVTIVALGDQRRFEVVAVAPEEGSTTASTVRSITITFSGEARRDAVESSFSIEPGADGSPRWRGSQFEYVLNEPLQPGEYTVRLPAGDLGRAAEPLREDFTLTFAVREPSVALVDRSGEPERLVRVGPDGSREEIITAPDIWDYAISPDGSRVAVIVHEEQDGVGSTRLEMVTVATGERSVVVDDPDIELAEVRWSPDSQAMLVVRRDAILEGGLGVPRTWVMRVDGEFISPVDPDGEPSMLPSWSPDGQVIAYVAPASGRLVLFRLGTQETMTIGRPRSEAAWSPDSGMITYGGVPEEETDRPIQPIMVQSLDGETEISLGGEEAARSQPAFLDASTVISLRRAIGPGARGTDLVVESLEDGSIVAEYELTPGAATVLSWDLAPSGERVVYTVQEGANLSTVILHLETGEREPVEPGGVWPRWLP
ncbi:MAG: hypothetical protein U5Q44_11475 [Dehalococcoidia bacterium]|nr:hypothetical protein [Dehalococcoidia bacterium]